MGKDKTANRTKNNLRPSSSGRTAEMLGTAPINPFMSFNSLKENVGADDQMTDSHLDPNFQVVLKKMNKKDAVTKLKALQEFSQLCASSEPDQVVAILPFWPRLYSFLALDVEHRVREAAHIAHRAVISKVKRNIAPYLKQLAGPWFVAQCDTYAPAASAASLALNEAFPPNKLSEAIAFCQEEILYYITDNLIVLTPQTMCNAKTMTPEEIESKYLRTVISSLQGYGLYLARLTAHQLQSAKEPNRKLISDAKFWKYSKQQAPQVRSAWFGALSALCRHGPFLIAGEEKRVGQSVFGSLDEGDAAVLPVVWEAALVALVAMDGLLEAVSFEKLVLPKLLKVCREGGKGSAAVIFPSLLPLLSKLPSAVVKDAGTFHEKFFSSIQQGFSQRTVQLSSSESKAVASAFVECLHYVIQLNLDNETLGLQLTQKYLFPCLCESILVLKQSHISDALYSSVSQLLHSWGRCPEGSIQRTLLHSFFSDLSAAVSAMALGKEVKYSYSEDSLSAEKSSQGVANKGEQKEKSVQLKQTPLKDILKSQVYFMTFLLEKQSRPLKVKFADSGYQENLQEKPLQDCKTMTSEVTYNEIRQLGKSICCCYFQAITKLECCDYLPPLSSLVKILNISTIYSDLATCVNLSSERELFYNYFINWLKPQNALFCREAASLSIPLLGQLPTEDQNILFNVLLKDGLDVTQLLWVVEESTTNNDAAVNWLRSPYLALVIKEKTEEAAVSDNITATWELLSHGCSFARDGDHMFCHSALENILNVIMTFLKDTSATNDVVPPWTTAAAEILMLLYDEKSPFLRTSNSPQRALSVAFEVCLANPHIAAYEALAMLWQKGARSVARMHGHSSPTILQLCSSFADSVLALLLKKHLHSEEVLVHAASQLAQLVEIVTNCFADIDGDDQRRDICSLILTTVFSGHSSDSEEGESSELKDIFALQHFGIESLADCVEPFHVGIDCSETIPKSTMTELVGIGYWGMIETFVLNELSSMPSFENFNNSEESFYSLDLFLDLFVLLSDVGYTAQHFPFSELGNALLQLAKSIGVTLKKVISSMKPSTFEKVHELLSERSQQIAAYKRAERYWRSFSSDFPSGYCKCFDVTPSNVCGDDSLLKVDLSPLEEFSEKLLEQGLNEETTTQAKFWVDVIFRIQIHHNARFLSNDSIDTCSVPVICDTLRAVKFLNAVVSCAPQLLGNRNWDQVMISLASWIHCAYESLCGKPSLGSCTVHYSRKVCALVAGLCQLFVSFCQNVVKLENGSVDLSDTDRGSLKDSLPQEWQEVFAGECEHNIFAMWTNIVENLESSEESPPMLALLNHLGEAVQAASTRFLQPSRDADVAYEPLLELAPQYLLHNLSSVRLTAFYLLFKIVPHMVKHDAASFADLSNAGDDGQDLINSEEKLSLLKFEDVLNHAQTIISAMLSDIKIGTCCTVQPFTDAYTYTSGYLFVWSLILEMCKEAETDLMCQYAMWLKNSSDNYADTFLDNVFRLLPQHAFEENVKTPLDYFSKGPNIYFGACWTSGLIEHLACNALCGILSSLPAVTRQWWSNIDPKHATLIDRVVSRHFSPRICETELSSVAKMQDKAVENMSVCVYTNVREVVATYTVDDLTMELVVRIPKNHPLSPMVVEIGKRNASAASQWRQWIMQLTMFLTHQNGSLWDGLALWRNNVMRRYEGVEECYICFCVLSGSNFQLPKLSCRTCRKKFHSTCLYKWFQTSNKSTCPICRNLF